MNRLDKLKEELATKIADDYIKQLGRKNYYDFNTLYDYTYFCAEDGFDAASAEYEKIIAELEGALESIIEIDLITHKMHPEYEGQFSEYADIAKEALQKLKEFRGRE